MKDKTYTIEFLDADNNDHFTKVKPFANKKEATVYAKLILATLLIPFTVLKTPWSILCNILLPKSVIIY